LRLRAIERGVASVAERFTGFEALPAPCSTPWWQILQVRPHAPWPAVEASFRKLASERQPDRGGSEAMTADLNRARRSAAGKGRRPMIAAGLASVLALAVTVGAAALVVTDSLEDHR